MIKGWKLDPQWVHLKMLLDQNREWNKVARRNLQKSSTLDHYDGAIPPEWVKTIQENFIND